MSRAATPPTTVEPDWVERVLHFWFEEVAQVDWFMRSERFDGAVRSRFLDLHARLAAAPIDEGAAPRTLLATVIVLDQFSRNLFRDDARAFASDAKARQLARAAVERGLDDALAVEERFFVYLPFEHSENRDDQSLSVRLVGRLGNEEWTKFAVAHRDVIERFGRFPTRNAALGRASTPAEITFLRETSGR